MSRELPRTLFVGIGANGVAWYRCALPAMYLDCDWVGAVGEPPNLQFVTGLTERPAQRRRPARTTRSSCCSSRAARRGCRRSATLQAAGTTVLFEIDDYVHGVRKQSDHVHRKAFGLEALDWYERCMAACDGVICSTEWLAERYRRFNPRVWVCRNGIDLGRYNLTRPRRPGVRSAGRGGIGPPHAALAVAPRGRRRDGASAPRPAS